MLRPSLAQGYLAFTMLIASAIAAQADEQRIGAAAAVVPATSGSSVSGMAVQIIDGSTVFHQQRVVTEAEGRAQLVFLDGSAVTIGPRSELTLDEFVYDPDQRLAGASMNVSRGVVRYVGGKISKTVDVKIKTPTATIGVRGGIVVVDIEQGGRTNAYFLYGDRMTVTADGATEVAQRPGSVISFAAGRPPAPARLASAGEMRQALGGLQAPPRQQQPGQPGVAPQGQHQQGQNQGQPGQNQQGQQAGNPAQPGQGQQGQNQGQNQGQPGQNQQANRQGQPGAGQPGSNQPVSQQGQAAQPANAPARGPGGGPNGPMMANQPGPLGGPGQFGGSAGIDRGALAARSEGSLPPALGGNNSRMGPANIAPHIPGNFGRVGPPGPQANGPIPGAGPGPQPINGLPRLPPPPPPPQPPQ